MNIYQGHIVHFGKSVFQLEIEKDFLKIPHLTVARTNNEYIKNSKILTTGINMINRDKEEKK